MVVVSKESCSNFNLGSLDLQLTLIQNRLALPSVSVPSVFKVPYVVLNKYAYTPTLISHAIRLERDPCSLFELIMSALGSSVISSSTNHISVTTMLTPL